MPLVIGTVQLSPDPPETPLDCIPLEPSALHLYITRANKRRAYLNS